MGFEEGDSREASCAGGAAGPGWSGLGLGAGKCARERGGAEAALRGLRGAGEVRLASSAWSCRAHPTPGRARRRSWGAVIVCAAPRYCAAATPFAAGSAPRPREEDVRGQPGGGQARVASASGRKEVDCVWGYGDGKRTVAGRGSLPRRWELRRGLHS